MSKIGYLFIIFLFPLVAIAKQVALDYEFPMYIGENKYNEFIVTIQYEYMSKPINLLSNKALNIPGIPYLKGILHNIDNEKALKRFINKKRKIKYTDRDFDLLFPGVIWLKNSNTILIKGYTQIGRYHFLVLSADGFTKVIALENSNKNIQIPSIDDNHFSYMLPIRALIGSFISGSLKTSNINKKNQNCMIRNFDNSCNLYMNAKVNKYKGNVMLQTDDLSNFLKKANVDGINNRFSNSFSETDKSLYLKQLVELSPLASIEFSNSVIAYFGKTQAGKVEISRLVKFRKNSGNLQIQMDSKFNDIDSALSSSLFIQTLLSNH